jgi:UDP-glucose 6-dehydrogenase
LLATKEALEIEPELEVSIDLSTVLSGADVVVVLNSETIYAEIDWPKMSEASKLPYVVDTRGTLDGELLQSIGFTYDVLGS